MELKIERADWLPEDLILIRASSGLIVGMIKFIPAKTTPELIEWEQAQIPEWGDDASDFDTANREGPGADSES